MTRTEIVAPTAPDTRWLLKVLVDGEIRAAWYHETQYGARLNQQAVEAGWWLPGEG